MPTTDTKLQQLVINVGTKAQIESAIAGGTITQDMLSVATDGDTYIQGVKVNGTELTPDSNNKVNVTVPTDTGDLTNNAGFITGITSSDVTTALGYTPYNSSNPSGYQENVIETVKVNGTALTPSSKAVDITVPTNNNQLTNGAGYITSSALSGYATETWVGQQGFLTSTALNGYATEQWVGQQGYITGITSSDVTTALGYTPYNSSNPNGYQENVLEGVQVNGTDLTITNKKVNVSVPTQASDINAQPTLVSGTNIKTVNGNSLLGSGDLVISGLPSQTSQSGKFLTTNGTSASWANIPTEIPSQSGQNGKFLTTNGSSVSWATVNALPSQTGNSGKYLTTNGTTASWGEIAEYTAAEVETLWGSL